jgi:hypothetical protein
MIIARRIGVCVLVGGLWACGDDASDKNPDKQHHGDGDENPADGDQSPGDDLLKACDAVTAEAVSEILGVTVLGAPQDSTSSSVCFYEAEGDVTTNGGLRIEYDGAQYFEQTRETLESSYEGTTTKDVSGVGDAAFSHFYVQELGSFTSGAFSLVASKGDVLVGVTVGEIDLAEEVGLEKAKEIMALALAELD